jgi:TRAP-type mannitol/chloroaromatic compound transport system permease large subunit
LFEPEASSASLKDILKTLALPLLLIILVLGSIIAGIATPTEASAIGAMGALLIVLINGRPDFEFYKRDKSKDSNCFYYDFYLS